MLPSTRLAVPRLNPRRVPAGRSPHTGSLNTVGQGIGRSKRWCLHLRSPGEVIPHGCVVRVGGRDRTILREVINTHYLPHYTLNALGRVSVKSAILLSKSIDIPATSLPVIKVRAKAVPHLRVFSWGIARHEPCRINLTAACSELLHVLFADIPEG